MQSIIIASIAAFGTILGILIQVWHQHRITARQIHLQEEANAANLALEERKTKLAEAEVEQQTIRFWRHEAESNRKRIEELEESLAETKTKLLVCETQGALHRERLTNLETQLADQKRLLIERDAQIGDSIVTIRTLSQRIAEMERQSGAR